MIWFYGIMCVFLIIGAYLVGYSHGVRFTTGLVRGVKRGN